MFKANNTTINKIVVNKILRKWRISVSDAPKNINTKASDILKIYRYFRNKHKSQSIVDKLHYVLENNLSNDILSLFLSQRFRISLEDLEYILIHCDLSQLHIITDKVLISLKCLEKVFDTLKCNQKIIHLLNYMFYKYAFPYFSSSSNETFHAICCYMIKQDNINAIKHILKKRRRFQVRFDYQILINTSIKYKKLNILKHFHNDSLNDSTSDYVIDTSMVYWLCANGEFEILNYIVETKLTSAINNEMYMECISEGLKSCNKRLSPNVTKFLTEQNQMYLKKLNLI